LGRVYFNKQFGVKCIMKPRKRAWSFNKLVGFIQQVHSELSAHAGRVSMGMQKCTKNGNEKCTTFTEC
jgi:hypothetical protein